MLATVISGLALLTFAQSTPWTDVTPHHVRFVKVADPVQLEVLDFGGSGRPLILLAGLGNTAHVYDDIAPKLASLGHVYAITRRGYGASSRPDSGYDVARLGEDVLEVMNALRLDTAVLIGHSIAGQELSYLAGRHRDRIAALVYLDAAYRYAFDVPGEFDRALASLPSPPANPPVPGRQPHSLPEAERRQARGSVIASEGIRVGGGTFVDIRVPALAIFASPHDIGASAPNVEFDEFDRAMTDLQAKAFERGVPGARVVRWARVSHYLFLVREDDVINEIRQFLADISH